MLQTKDVVRTYKKLTIDLHLRPHRQWNCDLTF